MNRFIRVVFFKYFSLPTIISPYKCSILPLMSETKFDNLINSISKVIKLNK